MSAQQGRPPALYSARPHVIFSTVIHTACTVAGVRRRRSRGQSFVIISLQ